MRVNFHDFLFGNGFLTMKTKAHLKKTDKLNFFKSKNYFCFKRHHQESEKQPGTRKKISADKIRNWYKEYIKNSHNSMIKRQRIQFKNGQSNLLNISSNTIYK